MFHGRADFSKMRRQSFDKQLKNLGNNTPQIGRDTTFVGDNTSQMPRPSKKNLFSQIGQNIKTARELRGWSPKFFADKMDVHVHTVHDWENGTTDMPHSRVEQAAKELNMKTADLETLHETKPFVSIHAENDNHVTNHNGVVPSDMGLVSSLVQELRSQLAKKDEQIQQRDARIANLESRIDDLLDKLGK